jgi:separase
MSDHEFVDLLKDSNVFLFSGHGGGEKHWSGSLVQRLGSSEPKIALLMGCSSARPYGDYWASFITPFHYMIGGFRIVVGTLWDVLGRELDRMTRKIIESISNEISLENLNRIFFHIIHEARAQAKLDHLSAASLVVYVASN